AAEVGRVQQLVRQLLLHRLAVAARAGISDEPADAEREAAVRVHFDRHLVVRAADAARLHLEARLDVVQRLLEHLQGVIAGLFLDDVEALVEDPLRGAPLAVAHDGVDELADQRAVVERVGRQFALRNFTSAWHVVFLLLRALCAVLRSTLLPALHADRVERAADDVVADARQVLHTAAANQHQRVLLQVVADAGDVGRHLDAVGEAHARHLAERGVRLLRRLGEHTHADAALLRAHLQRWTLRLGDDLLASLANELTDSRHKGVGSHFFEDTPIHATVSGVSSKNDSRPLFAQPPSGDYNDVP